MHVKHLAPDSVQVLHGGKQGSQLELVAFLKNPSHEQVGSVQSRGTQRLPIC
jgi:hypothetical protein